jgi:predicted transcriptional regulator with HTH domain
MWDLQHLTTLWTSMACYRDSFTFYFLFFNFYPWQEYFAPLCLNVKKLNSWVLTLTTGISVIYKKHVNIVTDFLRAFLGNGSVNIFECAKMEDVSQWANVISPC